MSYENSAAPELGQSTEAAGKMYARACGHASIVSDAAEENAEATALASACRADTLADSMPGGRPSKMARLDALEAALAAWGKHGDPTLHASIAALRAKLSEREAAGGERDVHTYSPRA